LQPFDLAKAAVLLQFFSSLLGESPWPFRLENALDDDASYRFTIDVIGEGLAKTICIAVVWTKRWDAITGSKVQL
jgi:hypothetical protein